MSKKKGFTKPEIASLLNEFMQSRMNGVVNEFLKENNLTYEDIKNITTYAKAKDDSKTRLTSTKTIFIKLFEKGIEKWVENQLINYNEFGFLVHLSKYVDYENNYVVNENGKPMCLSDIEKVCFLKKRALINTMNKFIEVGLIFKQKNGRKNYYMINPEILYKGVNIDKELKQKLKKDKII